MIVKIKFITEKDDKLHYIQIKNICPMKDPRFCRATANFIHWCWECTATLRKQCGYSLSYDSAILLPIVCTGEFKIISIQKCVHKYL